MTEVYYVLPTSTLKIRHRERDFRLFVDTANALDAKFFVTKVDADTPDGLSIWGVCAASVSTKGRLARASYENVQRRFISKDPDPAIVWARHQ